MPHSALIKRIQDIGVILIVRTHSPQEVLEGVRAAVEGGLKAVEVTSNVPGAPGVLREIRRALGDEIVLGAGTILRAEDAEDAVDAGAQYLVAPNVDDKVIGMAKRLKVAVFPGAFTPTEVARAWDLGADAVKVFPASVGGPAYIKAIRAPLPNIPLIPTGGVNQSNVGDYLNTGALAVGVGGSLFDLQKVKAHDWKGITDTARRFMAAVQTARS